MRTLLLALLLACLTTAPGCPPMPPADVADANQPGTTGDMDDTPAGDDPAAPDGPADPADPIILERSAGTARVRLPEGMASGMSDLSVFAALEAAPVSADGGVQLELFAGGPQLATVETAGGAILLLGWVDPDDPGRELSARTTAEVLAYFDSGGWLLASDLHAPLIAALAGSDAVDPLAAEIERQYADGASDLEAMLDMLTPLRTTLATTLRKADETAGVLVQPPTSGSGITVTQTGLDSIVLRNDYRRRALAFIDRLPGNEELTRVKIRPTDGAGTLADLLANVQANLLFGADNVVYAGVSSDPIRLPLHPADAERTDYRVTVAGAGLRSPEVNLRGERATAHRWLVAQTVLMDLVGPLLAHTVIPVNQTAVNRRLNLDPDNPIVSSAIAAINETLPGIWERAAAGEVRQAFDEIVTAIGTDGTIRDVTFILVGMYVLPDDLFEIRPDGTLPDLNPNSRGAFWRRTEVLSRILTRIDVILTGLDSLTQFGQIIASRPVEVFEVSVTRAQVLITPEIGDIATNQRLTFTASVPAATGDGEFLLEYTWHTTGRHGLLNGATTELTTRSSTVTYVPTRQSTGMDEIWVEARNTVAGDRRELGGSDRVPITVRALTPQLLPRRTSLSRNESERFVVDFPDSYDFPDFEELRYRWSTSGVYGGFSNGLNHFDTADDSQSWLTTSDREGVDTIRVEAYAVTPGGEVPLGVAEAEVRVEQRKTIIFGSVEYRIEPQEGGRECASAHVIVPKWPGGARYDFFCYNFDDPLFFGTEFRDSINAENPRTRDGGGSRTPQVDEGGHFSQGLSGGCGAAPADDGWLRERFDGMIVEITVHYDD